MIKTFPSNAKHSPFHSTAGPSQSCPWLCDLVWPNVDFGPPYFSFTLAFRLVIDAIGVFAPGPCVPDISTLRENISAEGFLVSIA